MELSPENHAEYKKTRAAIRRMDDELARIDKRRDELLAELSVLEQRQEALAFRRFSAAASIAPIGFLPTELLGHIFAFGSSVDPTSFPYLVSHVCRKWRQVAIFTPALWSYIPLHNDRCFLKSQIRLERSRAIPIDIIYDYSLDNTAMSVYDVVGMMEFLAPFAPRWRSISLRFASTANLQIALLNCREDTPILEKIELESADSILDFTYMLEEEFLGGNTTALCTLKLRNAYLNRTPELLSNVTSLNLSAMSELPGLTWSVLAIIPLHHLTLEDLGQFGPEDVGYPLATLPALQTLTLKLVSEFVVLQTLFCIDMPILTQLTIASINRYRTFPWSHSRNVELSRRLPSLRHLAVRFGSFTHITFEHILRIMPGLFGLELEGWVPDDALFFTMTRSSSSYPEDMICPRLQGLTIIRPQRDPSHAVDLFVRSRSGPKGRLPLPLMGWALVADKKPPTEAPGDSDILSDDEVESCITDAVDADMASEMRGSMLWSES